MLTTVKPTHRLKLMDKISNQKNEVGAGWQNEDGSISIRLNLGIVLKPDRDLVLTLFPVNQEK